MFGKLSILSLILAWVIFMMAFAVLSVDFIFYAIILIIFAFIFGLIHWGVEVYGGGGIHGGDDLLSSSNKDDYYENEYI